MTGVAANVARVRERIAAAARRSGRRPEEITLVAVTKAVDPARIHEAVASGVTDLGENRVQEAVPKVAALAAAWDATGSPRVRWHMVGHLQRNKVRQALSIFTVIHSLDSAPLAASLNRQIVAQVSPQRRPLDVLVQVNVASEPQKFGVSPDALPALLRQIVELPGLRVVGLMTIAPLVDNPEKARPIFHRLRLLRDQLSRLRVGESLTQLSMGMSDDFEVAVEEGATMVRIGRAIFGEHPP